MQDLISTLSDLLPLLLAIYGYLGILRQIFGSDAHVLCLLPT